MLCHQPTISYGLAAIQSDILQRIEQNIQKPESAHDFSGNDGADKADQNAGDDMHSGAADAGFHEYDSPWSREQRMQQKDRHCVSGCKLQKAGLFCLMKERARQENDTGAGEEPDDKVFVCVPFSGDENGIPQKNDHAACACQAGKLSAEQSADIGQTQIHAKNKPDGV